MKTKPLRLVMWFPLAALLLAPPAPLHAAVAQPATGATPYQGWQHSGSVFVLTTPEGAQLPTSAAETDFPLLVRLHRDFFDFKQAQAQGDDIRFSTSTGVALPYQIEAWDAAQGVASIWVRVPTIKGNARQELKLYWGKAAAVSASSGPSVFNAANGYVSVWHMNEQVKDEVGTLDSKDVGTTATAGMVGPARHLAGRQGVFGGDKIPNYPAGSSSHTTEAWFRAEKPNVTVLAWGNEQAQGKVVMHYRSPPHVSMDCYFSGANVKSSSPLSVSEWVHAVHTYRQGETRIYINGVLDGTNSGGTSLAIKSPAKLWIGGWYNRYDFDGDIDEVRISSVARSADWVKLEYENQKPLQTLTGPVVQPGTAFSVAPAQATVLEGQSVTFAAEAGGAQKVYWILKRDGREKLIAVDRFRFTFDAGRVTGDQPATLHFKAVFANEVKTRVIPILIKENIPEPVFTLKAPASWDGRAMIEVVPQVANTEAMRAKNAGELNCSWNVADIAVIKQAVPGKLILQRAQNSGTMTVTATLYNGGQPATQSVTIKVKEPKQDAWVTRTPAQDEKPEEGQFYARNDKNEGTLFYNGTLNEAAESVFLKVYADGKLCKNESRKLAADKAYAFTVKLKPGLIKYSVEFGAKTGGREAVLHTVTNLVCGDAYLINGQSNALATDTREEAPPYNSDWIRSFGSTASHPQGARLKLWGHAVWKNRDGEKLQLGYWGMELAKRLVESQKIPICIINGAVGGTRIDQHQRNPSDPEDVTTIYGRLLWRVEQAKLTDGIRGILWHQGENDQGADGPTGGYGWETYRRYFVEMSAAWKQDYPNLQHYYVFQIWPKACSMGVNGSDNMLREVQRTLPALYSRMSVMSTLGIEPPGGCHYPLTGWAEFARLIQPLIERDNYAKVFTLSITPPDLKRVYYASAKQNEIVLEFDQPVKGDATLAGEFYLDGEKNKVASCVVSGNVVLLKLTAPSTAQKLTYLDSKSWSQTRLLRGENGIAALTFCGVPILPKPAL
jgi:hypothetical protein